MVAGDQTSGGCKKNWRPSGRGRLVEAKSDWETVGKQRITDTGREGKKKKPTTPGTAQSYCKILRKVEAKREWEVREKSQVKMNWVLETLDERQGTEMLEAER